MILNGWCDEDISDINLINICAKLAKNKDGTDSVSLQDLYEMSE